MDEIEEHLALYPQPIQELSNELRELIKETIPGTAEKLYRGWQLIGYRAPAGSGSRYFAYVAPYEDHVRLGFEWGILLADEAGLLQGSGTQVRELRPYHPGDYAPELLAQYIREAAAVALLGKEEKANLALKRQAERERP